METAIRYATAVLCGTLAGYGLAAPAGDAVRAVGGPTFSANAADAIQETCVDLVVNAGSGAEETPEQEDLRINCGNMVRTTLNVLTDGEAAVNEYGFSTDTEVYSALRQFSGEETSSQGRYATETVNRQFSAVSARMSAIRQGSRAASGLSFNLQGTELLAHDAGTAQTPLIGGNAGDIGDRGFAWFANFDYGFGDRDGTDNESEYEYDSYQVTFGVDYAWSSGWAAGGIVSYSDHSVDFAEGGPISPVAGGSMDTDGYTLSGFAQYQQEQFYLSGVAGYGILDHDMTRRVRFTSNGPGASPDRSMVGSTESDQLATQVTGGWLLGTGATSFDFYAGFDYLDIQVDGFTERDTTSGGGLNLAFGDQDIESLQSLVGVVVRHVIVLDNAGVLVPYAGAEWRHEFENDARVVDARYAQALGDINGNGASTNFIMPTDEPDADFGELTLGLSLQMRNSMFLFVQWQSVVALDNASANLVTAGIRGTF